MFQSKPKSACQIFEERFKSKELAVLKPLATPEQACKKCFQCGFVWLKKDTLSLWAYCNCVDGDNKKEQAKYKLPQYSILMSDYIVNEFPVKAFYPRVRDTVMNQLWERVVAFKKDLQDSEEAWNYVEK